jgi:hypothetical protein
MCSFKGRSLWSFALLVTVFGCGGKESPTRPTARVPTSLVAQTATSISGTVAASVTPSPSVKVLDASGSPVPNVSVTFAVTSGGGTLENANSQTGNDGVATLGRWTLGTTAGQQKLTATVQGLTAVEFIADAKAGAPASVSAQSGASQSAIVGTAVATVPIAIVRDQFANPVPDVAVTFAVAQGGGVIAGGTVTTDAAGTGRPTSWTLGTAVGLNSITASVAGVASPATFTATATVGPPASLSTVTGTGQSGVVNSALATIPTFRAADAFGNSIVGATVAFTLEGGGSTVNSSASTGNDGVASSGAWTLGRTAGTNSLTASLGGLRTTITAIGAPGPASALLAIVTPGGSPTVGTVVSPSPAVRVTDAFGNSIASAPVLFTVASGGGAIVGGSAASGPDGLSTAGSWTLGIRPGAQSLRASLANLTPITFTVDAVAGPPASMSLIAGGGQFAEVLTPLPIPPVVQVRDQYDNPVPARQLTFSVSGGGGSVTPATITTNAHGTAAVGAWNLGPIEGVQTLNVSVFGLPTLQIVARAVPSSHFEVTLRYLTSATSRQQQAFQRAVDRWRKVIIGDLADVPVNLSADYCGEGEPALSETIDDLLIYVKLEPIDGPGAVLGSAGPCTIRLANGLTVIGSMRFDTADLADMEASGQLDDVILHEMGHILGIGTLWSQFGLLAGAGTSDPFYTGVNGRAGFSLVGGNAYLGNPVPVENIGGAGTRDAHWRESLLHSELMTGFAEAPGSQMPLSLVTIGSIEDMGYDITPWGFDNFIFGVNLVSGSAGVQRQLTELPPRRPPVAIDALGTPSGSASPLFRVRAKASRIREAREAPVQVMVVKKR